MAAPSVLRLIKAHAYGNDFLIVARAPMSTTVDDLADLARRACDRHRGVGADGLMLVDEHATGRAHAAVQRRRQPLRALGQRRALRRRLARASAASCGAGDRVDHRDGRRPRSPDRCSSACTAVPSSAPTWGSPSDPRRNEIEVGGQPVTAVVLRVGQSAVRRPRAGDRRSAAHAGGRARRAPVLSRRHQRRARASRAARVRSASSSGSAASGRPSRRAPARARPRSRRPHSAARLARVDVVAPGGTQRVEWTDDGSG